MEQSLILNLYPPPVKHFMCQIVSFCAKTNQFYSIFFLGRPPDPTPSPHLPQCSDSMLEKKKKLRGTNKKSHKKYLLNPFTYPPPLLPLFFFGLLKFKVGGADPPPPPPSGGGDSPSWKNNFWIGARIPQNFSRLIFTWSALTS